MANYDLEEQEQLAEIKTWWKQYGNQLINVLLGAALLALAWQGWNWYQRSQASQASMVYHVLQNAVAEKDSARIKAASGELLEKYSGSTYAALGALTAAKSFVEAGDVKTAKAQLTWVVEHGKDELRDLARLRLAVVLLDEKSYDEALKAIDGTPAPAFAARFSDTRGDILAAQGKRADARAAYQAALSQIAESDKSAAEGRQGWQTQSAVMQRELVRQKLDAQGGAQ